MKPENYASVFIFYVYVHVCVYVYVYFYVSVADADANTGKRRISRPKRDEQEANIIKTPILD